MQDGGPQENNLAAHGDACPPRLSCRTWASCPWPSCRSPSFDRQTLATPAAQTLKSFSHRVVHVYFSHSSLYIYSCILGGVGMTFTAAPTPDCSRGTDGDDSGALPSSGVGPVVDQVHASNRNFQSKKKRRKWPSCAVFWADPVKITLAGRLSPVTAASASWSSRRRRARPPDRGSVG